jgi:hypothetical protein
MSDSEYSHPKEVNGFTVEVHDDVSTIVPSEGGWFRRDGQLGYKLPVSRRVSPFGRGKRGVSK